MLSALNDYFLLWSLDEQKRKCLGASAEASNTIFGAIRLEKW
jgi:hypothetical protein